MTEDRRITQSDAIKKGEVAETILNDPVFKEVFKELEQLYVEDVLAVDPKDDELRFRATLKVHVLRDVRQVVTSYANTAKLVSKRRAVAEARQKR